MNKGKIDRRKDQKLQKLHQQKAEIEEKIKKRRAEIGRHNGDCFEKLEEISCDLHPEANFIRDDSIDEPPTFHCSECRLGKAYRCPVCGFVKGEPEKVSYNNLAPLAGSAGYKLICRICGTKLKRVATVRS